MQTARAINQLLESRGNFLSELPLEISAHAEKRQRQAYSFIASGKPVELVILGFPAKSPNRQKTFSEHADLGEVEGLRTLQRLASDIQTVYAPGAEIRVCSDGHIFADLVHVSDPGIDRFQEEIEKIIVRFGFDSLSTFSARSLYPRLKGDSLRAQMMKDFAQPLPEIKLECHASEDGRALFNGIHRFLFEDDLVLFPQLSRNQLRERSKQRAYRVIQRSQAFSRLVELQFPEAIRLSIHPHAAASPKLGIQLVPGPNRWATPWHNVLVITDAGPCLMPRYEAERQGAALSFFDNQFAFFELRRGM